MTAKISKTNKQQQNEVCVMTVTMVRYTAKMHDNKQDAIMEKKIINAHCFQIEVYNGETQEWEESQFYITGFDMDDIEEVASDYFDESVWRDKYMVGDDFYIVDNRNGISLIARITEI